MDQIFYHDTKLNKFYTNFHEVNLAPLFDPLYLDCLEWIYNIDELCTCSRYENMGSRLNTKYPALCVIISLLSHS